MMNQVAQDHISGTVHAYADDGEEVVVMEGIEAHQIRSSLRGETEAPPIVSAPHWRPHASFFPFQTLNEAPFFDTDDIKRMLHLLFLLLLEMQSSYAQVNNDIDDQGATKAWVDQQIQRAQEAGYGVLSASTCRSIVQYNKENRQAAQQKIRIELQESRLHDMDLTMEKLFKNPLQHTKETLRGSIMSQGLWSLRAKKLLEVAMPTLTHTNPQPKILQIGSAGGANSTTLTLLQLLQPKRGTQLFSTFTYAPISSESLENAEDDFADVRGFEVRSWDAIGGDKHLAQSYDIIVCAGVLLQNQTPHISKDVLLPIVRDLGFDIPEDDQHKDMVPPILRLRHLNQLKSSSTTVSIVTDKEGSALIKSFQSVLHSYSIPVRTYNADTCISESDSLPTEGTLVFFLDLDRPWIYHLRESGFPAFIQLLSTGTSKRPIVWVTPLSQISCDDPRSAMIYGLARTLRSELKADITIVEVDPGDVANSEKFASSLTRIIQHLPHRCFDGALDPDFEFAITREHGIVDVIIAQEASDPNQVLFGQEAAGIVTVIRFIITSESDRLLLENAFGIAVDFIVSAPAHALSWPKATCMIGFGGLFPDWALQYLSPTGIFLDVAVAGSVAILEDVTRAVNAADHPIAGVFQMSMVLRDNAILRMTYDEWRTCIEPKIQGTENLHKALAQSSLDLFVLFSSIGGLVGNIGQANYNAANTYLDAFVRYRHNLGLPASVIDIGIMGGIGVIASTGNMQDRAQAAGYHVLCEEDLLEAITISIHHSPLKSGRRLRWTTLGLTR
ncbi:Lovastatin diketide synthase LovF [Colletotrichum sp. SAR11_59]|nr:Lovastatin diketide synthase LovF [Colletotrichum sp. SAR11_59]